MNRQAARLLSVGLLWTQFNTTQGTYNATSEDCFNTPYFPALHLTCDSEYRIHVISKHYQQTDTNCKSLASSCQLIQETRTDGLTTTCNGGGSCWDPVQDFWMTEKCGKTTSFKLTIFYECIPESSILDVCKTTAVRSTINQIYLASPNFFKPTSLGMKRPCQCHITGHLMDMELLELHLRNIQEGRGTLALDTDSGSWDSEHHWPRLINAKLMQGVSVVNVTFNANNKYGQLILLEITGMNEINVSCNGQFNSPVTIPSIQRIHPQIATTRHQDPDTGSSLLIVSITCGVIIFLLLLVIVIILMYNKWKSRSNRFPNMYRFPPHPHVDVSFIQYNQNSDKHINEDVDLQRETGPALKRKGGVKPPSASGQNSSGHRQVNRNNVAGGNRPQNDGYGEDKVEPNCQVRNTPSAVDSPNGIESNTNMPDGVSTYVVLTTGECDRDMSIDERTGSMAFDNPSGPGRKEDTDTDSIDSYQIHNHQSDTMYNQFRD